MPLVPDQSTSACPIFAAEPSLGGWSPNCSN